MASKQFDLKCDVCKRIFNAKTNQDWNYYYNFQFKEMICCSNRCQSIYLAGNEATKDFDETLKLVS
jgi:hypothetical protein